MLVKFWTRFARSGDPNGAEAPATWVGLGLANSDKKIIPRKTATRNSVPTHVSDENMLSILFAGARFYFKLIFFMPFPFVLSFGIASSVNFGMPRNEHFLPRNNGSCSESIPEFFRDEIPLQTLGRPERVPARLPGGGGPGAGDDLPGRICAAPWLLAHCILPSLRGRDKAGIRSGMTA